jgi:Cu/Zn superoxide dismutase
VTITLHAVDNSGVTGTATLTPMGESTMVTLEINNPPPGALPAHIHFDTCANPSDIRFGLSNVVDGKSETTVSGSIAYLRRGHGRFSINVHRAQPDLPIIACGDVPPG